MGEHTIHRDLAVGDKAGAVRLPHRVKCPGRKNGKLLADHVWTDVDGDVIAFANKTDRTPGTRAAHGSNASVRRGTTIECQISPFAVRQVFDRRNGISGLRVDGDVRAEGLGKPQALRTDIHRDDTRAHSLGKHGGTEAHGTLAKDGDGIATRQVQAA